MKKKLPLIRIIILFIAISCVLGYYTYRKLYHSYKVQEDTKIQADQQLEQEKT